MSTPTTPSTSPTSPAFTMDAESDPHTMSRDHRLRLMRSMRKITAILGETPVVETSSPLLAPPNPTKRGFFFQASASLSSLTLPFQKSETTTTTTMPHHHPEDRVSRPSLFLRLPDTFEPLPTPIFSPTLDLALSPVQEQETTRRLRMAKITRTLGENIPPALILSTPAVKRRRRASSLVVPESAFEQQMFQFELESASASASATRRPPRPNAPPRAMSAFVVSPTVDPMVEEGQEEPFSPLHVHPVAGSPDALLSPAEWLRPLSRTPSTLSRSSSMHRRGRSQSGRAEGAAEREPAGLDAPPTYDESHHHIPTDTSSDPFARGGPFALYEQSQPQPRSDAFPARVDPNSLAASLNPSYTPQPQRGEMQRQENDWSGEWVGAVGNMDDVVRGLRGLKLK
ncbi:hypothetical protein B0H16DRAFT_1728672 [Mycena metata]|uniref:Uncharacterized protein n=1 Tax=Mycena metata TaxID=1033252 RepID=A0AAD7N0B3_9AGAR|nr:hypothetical protein B0H16DRAFT_1728672 [Mycena metata]